jgi:hypothetical protein
MDYRGQGAIEYLLIIGAAILVVAIVILAVTGVLSGGQSGVGQGQSDVNTSFNNLQCTKDCNYLASNACCTIVPNTCSVVGTACTKKVM